MNTIIVPVIIGLVAVATRVGLPTRFAPLLAVVLGVLSMWVSDVTLLQGIIFGLSSSGLYDVAKTTIAGK